MLNISTWYTAKSRLLYLEIIFKNLTHLAFWWFYHDFLRKTFQIQIFQFFSYLWLKKFTLQVNRVIFWVEVDWRTFFMGGWLEVYFEWVRVDGYSSWVSASICWVVGGEWTTFVDWWGWVEVDRSIFWVGGG